MMTRTCPLTFRDYNTDHELMTAYQFGKRGKIIQARKRGFQAGSNPPPFSFSKYINFRKNPLPFQEDMIGLSWKSELTQLLHPEVAARKKLVPAAG